MQPLLFLPVTPSAFAAINGRFIIDSNMFVAVYINKMACATVFATEMRKPIVFLNYGLNANCNGSFFFRVGRRTVVHCTRAGRVALGKQSRASKASEPRLIGVMSPRNAEGTASSVRRP